MSPLPSHPGTPDPSAVCSPCARCCRHVAVGIDPPDTVRRVSTALWFVYHRRISVYQSHDGDWFLNVPTDCEHLRPDGLCGVYESRPLLCREYDVEGCEGTSEERTLRRDANSNAGTFNQSDLPVHFGLGAATVIDRLRIVWPSGAEHQLTGVGVDQYLTLDINTVPVGLSLLGDEP
ncbi:MAG: hypothetical protein DYH06_12695 [Acidobacteria bacterium ACB2]|nr:hypothetical protein [Acidobacteria bacterium ACB2]